MSSVCRSIDAKRAMVISSEQFFFQPLADRCDFELVFSDDSHQAVVLAAQTHFDFIFISTHTAISSLDPLLAALHTADQNSKLYLVCRMPEEPKAMHLLQQGRVDEYIIYPFGLNLWVEEYCKAHAQTETLSSSPEKSVELLEKLVVLDDLTGLKNRRYLTQFLKQIIGHADKEKFNVTLLLFDIDNFKSYNDQYGHPIGDEVLRQVGELIKHSCRAHDVVARVGGDEFAVVFWDLPTALKDNITVEERRKQISEHPRETIFMAQRFRRQLSMANLSVLGSAGKGHLTISGGLASFPKDGKDERQLFMMADQAMLYAKRSGKNRIHIVGSSE